MIETITKQQNIVNDLRDSLEQYLSSEISEGTWYNITKTILEFPITAQLEIKSDSSSDDNCFPFKSIATT